MVSLVEPLPFFFTVMAIISYILDKNSIFAMLNEFIDAVITVLITVTFIVETTKYVKRNGKNRQKMNGNRLLTI
jgi:hypothetical protein